ncbi:superoxide dismutase [Streptosporangiaceae bacterium NEAU-GS5]|nr:superoxide dismutase [Streptosporangiaceae bacterium NEAU-GS5]
MKTTIKAVLLAGLVAALVAPPAVAQAQVKTAAATSFPTQFSLPDGFQPEGIAISGRWAFFGSRATGDIYRADLRTGAGKVVSKGPGTPSLGLKIDGRGRLFVSGGSGGDARVISLRTGKVLAGYKLTTAAAFINDVILTSGGAYFTDSTNPALYKVAFGRHGRLAKQAVTIPLSGDITYTTGNNANGIAQTPDRRALLVIQSNTGKLFRVNPRTGVAKLVDVGSTSLANGDGLLQEGRILYVVQNRLNTITVLRLDRHGTAGKVIRTITDSRFDVPTTVARFRNRLYLPNARFSTPPTPTTPYTVVAVTS